jgi:hypothetical protein
VGKSSKNRERETTKSAKNKNQQEVRFIYSEVIRKETRAKLVVGEIITLKISNTQKAQSGAGLCLTSSKALAR